MKSQPVNDQQPLKAKVQKPEQLEHQQTQPESAPPGLARLQQQIGNRAVQRLVTQRAPNGPSQVDEETAGKINQARGGGQALDPKVQTQMETSMGTDLSGVKVHTSSEAGELNQNLSARAFTTGNDIFFNSGEYQPDSSDGQKLLAHELTHVVQQSSGGVDLGDGGMKVNEPGDAYEQEADQVADLVVSRKATGIFNTSPQAVQAQEMPEEEEVQMQEEEEEVQMQEEEEEVQMQAVQREAAPEEEELQMQAIQREAAPEEEELQMKAIQREAAPEEEELQMKTIQREAAPEEEELQMKAIQREAAPEEEELQMQELQLKAIQREAAPEEEELQMQEMDEEEEVQMQEMDEEEEVLAKRNV